MQVHETSDGTTLLNVIFIWFSLFIKGPDNHIKARNVKGDYAVLVIQAVLMVIISNLTQCHISISI